MKRFLTLTLALVLLLTVPLALASCGGGERVCISVQDYGDIIVELYPDVAPITVENFKKLAADGHYDGSIFHRVISGFMIQGGQSPTGEDAEQIVGEFSANGVSNSLKHERGVISMARLGDAYYDHYYYNTASDQFFIVHETSPHLDGKYAAFGRVVSGMDIVDKIASVRKNSSDRPLIDIVITSVRLIEG